MMFYLTDLIKSNTADTNSLLYKVFHQIQQMCGTNFMDLGVRLPTNSNGGHKLFGGGHHGIFNNLPAPKVFDISGHACMKIGDILTQHFADGRGFEFSETTTSNRITDGIHGCKAMDLLIAKMKTMGDTSGNYNDVECFYGWMTTWSDSFLRSYVKQKMNNVWMHTITLQIQIEI